MRFILSIRLIPICLIFIFIPSVIVTGQNRLNKALSTWTALGQGTNSRVSAIAIDESDIYAGGEFTSAGGISASRIAKWDGNSWSLLGDGVNALVYAAVIFDGDLVIGGAFTAAGGNSDIKYIARWDGNIWTTLGDSNDKIKGTVNCILVKGNEVYI